MTATWGPKDPQATRDYGINWASDIGAANITTSTWTITGTDNALVEVSAIYEAKRTAIRLSGGTLGVAYKITNHIMMDDGEQDELTVVLKIKDR